MENYYQRTRILTDFIVIAFFFSIHGAELIHSSFKQHGLTLLEQFTQLCMAW